MKRGKNILECLFNLFLIPQEWKMISVKRDVGVSVCGRRIWSMQREKNSSMELETKVW